MFDELHCHTTVLLKLVLNYKQNDLYKIKVEKKVTVIENYRVDK